MSKYIVSFIIGASFLAGAANAEDLAGMKGLENVGSGSSQHSPSQVVILNHVPTQSQDQKTESLNSSSQRARMGWGTGESLKAMRDSRINKEAKNEQVLMEKLEVSRMEDEKSRLRRLFKIRAYNRQRRVEMGEEDTEFGSMQSDYEAETTYVPVQNSRRVVNVISAPAVQVASAPITPDVPMMTQSGSSTFPAFKGYSSKTLYYVKGQFGLGKYSASNTSTPIGTSSWGLSAGKNINSRWLVEVGLYKTSYQVNDPNAYQVEINNYGYATQYSQERTLNQYNFSGLLGFKLINANGFLTSLRGGLSYVRRDSESSDVSGFQSFRSNTIDGLLGVGVDVEIAKNVMIAASFDYYSNLLNDLASTNSAVVERVETANYYVLGLGLKLNF